jgi:hypothetical protein
MAQETSTSLGPFLVLLDTVVARLVPQALVGEKRKINKSRARDVSRALVVICGIEKKKKFIKPETRLGFCEDGKKKKNKEKERKKMKKK